MRNDIKLFDFGLSRELKDHLQVQPGKDEYAALYRLTAETGSVSTVLPVVVLVLFQQQQIMTCIGIIDSLD